MKHVYASALLLLLCSCSSSDRPDNVSSALDAGSEEQQAMPNYDETGALLRPLGWEQWVFLGSALNLSYSSGAPPPTDVQSVVYMEPTAYRYFKANGEFREGTMTALASYLAGPAGEPALGGTVPTGPSGFEMSVKDRERVPEGWAFYHFDGGPNAQGDTARALAPAQCFDCHDQHAETDHVFTQYYPALP